jgi:hypothetical protein
MNLKGGYHGTALIAAADLDDNLKILLNHGYLYSWRDALFASWEIFLNAESRCTMSLRKQVPPIQTSISLVESANVKPIKR